jgi:O-antigen/teichoic acid export membrane protein
MMVVGVLLLLANNWSSAAVLRFGREEYDRVGRLNKTFWARNIILFGSLMVVLCLCYFLRGRIAGYLGMPEWTVWLIAGTVLVSAWGSYIDQLLQAIHRMSSFAAIQVARSVAYIFCLSLILLIPFERTYSNVIVAGLCAGAAILVFSHLRLPPRNLFPVETTVETLRNVFLFSYPVIIGNSAAYLVDWVDVLVIKHYFEVADVGGYQVAYNVFTLLMGLMGSVTILTAPILISFNAVGREDLIVRYGLRLLPQFILLLSMLIGVGMSFFPFFFTVVYGSSFKVSGDYFQLLALGSVISVPLFFLSGVFAVYNWVKLNMFICVARALLKLIADLLLVPVLGPIGASIANIVSIIVAAAAYLLFCQRRWRTPLLWQGILVLPALLSLLSSQLIAPPWAFLVAPAIAVAAGYFLAKTMSLFAADDIAFLNHVRMPSSVRKGVARVYSFLAD